MTKLEEAKKLIEQYEAILKNPNMGIPKPFYELIERELEKEKEVVRQYEENAKKSDGDAAELDSIF